MSQYTWSLRTPDDMLDKARRELDRFRKSHEAAGGDQADHAINCVLTLVNLRDWLFQNHEARIKTLRYVNPDSGKPQFVSHVPDLSKYIAYQSWRAAPGELWTVVEALANGTKHFDLKDRRLLSVNVRTSVGANKIGDYELRPIEGWSYDGDSSEPAIISVEDDALRAVLVVKFRRPQQHYAGDGIESISDTEVRVRADRLLEDAIGLAREVVKDIEG